MTSHKTAGFIAGYQNKEAALPALSESLALGTGLGAGLLDVLQYIALPLVIFPAVVGAGAGLLHSKLTSPSKMDTAGAQKALELSELEEFATELKRRREAGTRQGKKEKSDARTLRL
jgi:hypothetical protein